MTSPAIRFVLDNCALKKLVRLPNYTELKAKILKSTTAGKIQVLFSHLTYLELTTGLSQDCLFNRQKLVREGLGLSENQMLLYPTEYMKLVAGKVDDLFISVSEKLLRDHVSGFLMGKLLSDYSATWNQELIVWKKRRNSLHKTRRKLLRESAKKYFELSEDKRRGWWSASGKEAFEQKIILSSIDSLFPNATIDTIETCTVYPSLRYWAEYWYSYLAKHLRPNEHLPALGCTTGSVQHSPNTNSTLGDTIDSMTVWYLDQCDYIVTEDHPFKCLLNEEPTNALLTNRAVSLEEFIEHLNKPSLIFRALIYDTSTNG